jgi:hypothetical protein
MLVKPPTRRGGTPVAYFVFRRPHHTRESFAAIRAYRPAQLFIIADGPRSLYAEDIDLCKEVRTIVAEVDWPCEVYKNFAEINLGCGKRVSSGLDWVFSEVDRCIILEDDCVASSDFFVFCEELLERYDKNETIWVVSGNSYQAQHRRGDYSYFFSKYPELWGWATWRRAWTNYKFDLSFLEEWLTSDRWSKCFPVPSEKAYWLNCFENVLSGNVDTWDYQWVGCVLYGGGLSATPNANLVKNIGFDNLATHTLDASQDMFAGHEITSLGKLTHPPLVEADKAADTYYREKLLGCV